MFWLLFALFRIPFMVARAVTPRRRYYRSCSSSKTPATPTTPAELAFGAAVVIGLLILLAHLGNSHTYPTPPAPGSYINNTNTPGGWYTGYDGNYYPDGFPTERTMPKPPPAPVAAAPPTTGGTNWVTIATVFGMVFGGLVILFMLGLMVNPKPLPGATAPAAPSPPRRRRPPPPPPKWRPYDQPFDL